MWMALAILPEPRVLALGLSPSKEACFFERNQLVLRKEDQAQCSAYFDPRFTSRWVDNARTVVRRVWFINTDCLHLSVEELCSLGCFYHNLVKILKLVGRSELITGHLRGYHRDRAWILVVRYNNGGTSSFSAMCLLVLDQIVDL